MSDNFIPALIGCSIAFLICVFITRAIFSIGTIVRNLKAQTALLGHLALKHDVDTEKVNKIMAESYGDVYVSKTAVKNKPSEV